MTFRVSWDEARSGERRVRRCETGDEARGFIRGLRVHPDHTNIALRRLAEDGQLVKMKIAELFDAPVLARAPEPAAVPASAPVQPQAPMAEPRAAVAAPAAVEPQAAAEAPVAALIQMTAEVPAAAEVEEASEVQGAAPADTLAAIAAALVEEVEIAQPVAAALAVVEEPAASTESAAAEAPSAPANDPHPAPQPARRQPSVSQTASMLRMAERWL